MPLHENGKKGRAQAILLWNIDPSDPLLAELFLPGEPPWAPLVRLDAVLTRILSDLPPLQVGDGARVEGVQFGEGRFYIGPGAILEPGVVLASGPVYIAAGARLRSGAYVRGPALIGAGALLGHSSEVKNGILLPGSAAPHFNYVGDSILGNRANLGAGAILSNLRLDGRPVRVTWQGKRQDSGLRKLGGLVGDGVQVGCNAVINPGTILWPGSHVAPAAAVRGEHGFNP